MEKRILIVDDEPTLRLSLKKILEDKNYKTLCTSSIEETLKLSPHLSFDLCIVDLNLTDGKGTQLISQLKTKHPYIQSILITGEQSINTAIAEAIHKGFFYFVTKPFDVDVLLKVVEKACFQGKILKQNDNLKKNIKKQFHFSKIIGQSESVLKLTELMHKVAKSNSNLLVTGDSGTGKELVARSIHCARNSSEAFISINCGAIPKDLLESEFFGHKKGSFTGAISNHKGCFEMAENGTLFLDEIGTMDLNLQVKLLRVLQEREFSPVGSTEVISTNAHIIAATNMDLEKAVKKGNFREDLFYRLNIIPLHIPSLRERQSDIPLLVQHFIKIFNKNSGVSLEGISDLALKTLCHYRWPGNIRELENLIERLSVLKDGGKIEMEDLPEKYTMQDNPSLKTVEISQNEMDFNRSVDSYENSLILKALAKTNWNRKQAADLLNLNRTTLVEKMKKKGLKPPEEKPKPMAFSPSSKSFTSNK
ncbi:MAG: sigma-54-dependent transcriptional regulator [Bdellovibrionales bacterium]